MAKSSAISNMQQAIVRFIKENLPKDKNQAQVGTVRGIKVTIGNKSYSYSTAVDMGIYDGDTVYCLVPDSGNTAAIIGKA